MSDEKARGIHARIPGQLSSERGFREMHGNACSLMMQFLLEMLAIASIHIQKIPLYRGPNSVDIISRIFQDQEKGNSKLQG